MPAADDGAWGDATDEELQRLFAAVMLAPTIEVCEALLRGDPAPVDRLDPVWAEKYGLR